MKKVKGFTLIELMAVIGVSAVLGSLIISLFVSSNKMLISANTDTQLQDEARIIMDAIENDLKVNKDIVILDSGKAFKFKNSAADILKYKFNPTTKELLKVKQVSGIDNVISKPSKNVEEFEVKKDNNQYKIYLKLKNNGNEYEFTSMITPRN